MGGAGWKWVQAHLHSTSAVDLLQSGHKTFYIDGGMILHKAFYNNPECALPGNNLSSMLQWIVEKLENLRLGKSDTSYGESSSTLSLVSTSMRRRRASSCFCAAAWSSAAVCAGR